MAAGVTSEFVRRTTSDPPAALGTEGGSREAPAALETPGDDEVDDTSTPRVQPDPVGTGCPGPGADAIPLAEPGGGRSNRAIVLGPQPVTSAAVTADYRFQGSLASSVGTAPDLVELSPGSVFSDEQAALGLNHSALRFPQSDGLSLAPTAGIIDSGDYTIELLFSLHLIEGWRKLVDFKNSSDDSGLYSFDGCLSFFDTAAASHVAIERYAYTHVVLTRDASTTVVGYVDGVRQFAFRDGDGLAVIDPKDPLRFFVDDTVTGTEDSGGAVARIRLYDGPLTGNEVAGLTCAELPDATCSLAWPDYITKADAICRETGNRFFATVDGLDLEEPDDLARWSEAAAGFSEEALAELYALPPPEAERDRLMDFYSVLEDQTDVLRRIAAAASIGAAARAERLARERIELTHRKDSIVFSLQSCPILLPA